ncbi:MAG: bile acid:sodium symporter family protein [Gammaproteobacteria bacterium]|nr:bile acid:sodium symporter family protein [Gammaproteobacteria bacterium]
MYRRALCRRQPADSRAVDRRRAAISTAPASLNSDLNRLTQLFPLWAIVFSLLAWLQPQLFNSLQAYIVPLLSVVMFGMGLTLHLSDFSYVLQMPRLIFAGIVLQYTIMPITAVVLSSMLGLDPYLTAGMILVGTCPGGTASNVICYLARGNVALSITLTAVSTLLAVILTPALTAELVSRSIQVPAQDMLLSILYMVIIPVTAGILLNHAAGKRLQPVKACFPLVSVAAIVVIIAIIVSLNADNVQQIGAAVLVAVMLHNVSGLALGYFTSRLLGYSTTESRTLAIEVGMQNSGLAVALAIKYFSATAALPGAIFSIWHNLSGSVLAGYWSRRSK